MSTDPATILLIEDELAIRRVLRASLAAYRIYEADSGRAGLQLAASVRPDCIILDLGLPDIDGLEVTRALRGWSRAPIIVLTARGQEQEKIALLDAGADDYVTKPFSAGELLARIRAALRLRRATPASDDPLVRVGPLVVDLAQELVWRDGAQVALTPTEYRLLAELVRRAGAVVTQRQLLDAVWGPAYADAGHYVRIYMQRLRHKLEADPARPSFLHTEPGVGYRLVRESYTNS